MPPSKIPLLADRQTLFRRLRPGVIFLVIGSAVAFLLLALPPLVLLLRAITTQAWQGVPQSDVILSAVGLSFVTSLITLLLTLLFGTPLAYTLARWRFPGRRIVNVFVELPIVMPPAVAGLALLLTFGRRGLLGPLLDDMGIIIPFTTAAVVLAQTFVAAPFYIRAAQIGFAGVPRDLEEAAQVDGASGWTLFRRITLPLAQRALAAGLILSWARAIGEFGATILFAGSLQGRTQTMPLLVYSIFERDIDAAIWTGLILIGLALVALIMAQWLRRDETTTHDAQ